MVGLEGTLEMTQFQALLWDDGHTAQPAQGTSRDGAPTTFPVPIHQAKHKAEAAGEPGSPARAAAQC